MLLLVSAFALPSARWVIPSPTSDLPQLSAASMHWVSSHRWGTRPLALSEWADGYRQELVGHLHGRVELVCFQVRHVSGLLVDPFVDLSEGMPFALLASRFGFVTPDVALLAAAPPLPIEVSDWSPEFGSAEEE